MCMSKKVNIAVGSRIFLCGLDSSGRFRVKCEDKELKPIHPVNIPLYNKLFETWKERC